MASCRSLFVAGGRAALPHLFSSIPAAPVARRFTRKVVALNRRPIALNITACALHQDAKIEMAPSSINDDYSSENWKIKMLYDGDCPLCMREVNMLRKRNEAYAAIKFVDICSNDYSPEENQGVDYKTAMGRIHAILSDGTVVRDVEAFRRLYEEVGLGWVYVITKYEPVATIVGAIYDVWAKYRLQITGRPSIDEIMELRKKSGESCGDDQRCKI